MTSGKRQSGRNLYCTHDSSLVLTHLPITPVESIHQFLVKHSELHQWRLNPVKVIKATAYCK